MNNSPTYDVIIVGAGPAGALLSYLLSCQHVRVLLIEKKNLPRTKACGGGVTPRAMALLPFDIQEVVEEECYSVKAFVSGKLVFEVKMDQPAITMVMRSKMDHFLVMKALGAGAEIGEGTNFQSLSGSKGNLIVETSSGVFQTRLIVGADGVNSRVARALGLGVQRQVMHGVEAEVYYPDTDFPETFKAAAHFDFGVVPEGYGWIFPKKDHLSVGIISRSKKLKNLKTYFKAYLKTKRIEALAEASTLSSHLIPYGPSKTSTLGSERGLLVGDAAGFADPITGEGVFFALKEAHLSAEIILEGLRHGYERLKNYTPMLWQAIGNDLVIAQRFAYLLYRFPRFSARVIGAHGERLGELHAQVIAGKKSYLELQQMLLRWSGLWNLLKVLAPRI